MSPSLSSSYVVSICVCVFVCQTVCPWIFVKETSCPPVAPNGKPSQVALPQAQSALNKQVCVRLAVKLHVTVCVSLNFFLLHGMLVCTHSVFSLSKVDDYSSYLWIIDFHFLATQLHLLVLLSNCRSQSWLPLRTTTSAWGGSSPLMTNM